MHPCTADDNLIRIFLCHEVWHASNLEKHSDFKLLEFAGKIKRAG
jgi:hypothetical protein